MKPRFLGGSFSLLIIIALLGSSFGLAAATDGVEQLRPQGPAPVMGDELSIEGTDLWFVELASPPRADGTPPGRLNREHNEFRQAAQAAGLRYSERFAFQTLWNGFSVKLERGQLSKLTRVPGVSAIWPVVTVSIPDTDTIAPDLATALAMTGADAAQSELGLTGAGVKVAIMDTGIDYNHPDLGGSGDPSGTFPAGRVTHGFDFVGDDFNAADPANDTPAPNPDPMDCNGHGTHVAGIVGADGGPDGDGALGVAPGVTFGAYKVFGCVGSTFADIMIDAMEMVLADGMDVLNMSIGAAFQWPQYPTATASDRLVNRGVSVVASIGNNGPAGVYAAGAPGLGAKVIGVASFDNSHINALTFNVNPSGQQVPYLTLATADDPPTSGTSAEVVFIGRGCPAGDGVTDDDPYLADPAGKVALIVRGDCTFQGKYQRAADAGAVGVVIHNNLSGLFAGGGVTTRGIFGIGISLADGQHIRSLLDGGETVTLTWTDERINAVNPNGGLISSFSSFGLSPDLALKPDIGAPGGLIRSTYPLALGSYATVSGTSMSAPHVAGGVALLLEARPNTSSQAVRGILQNSADPAVWWGNPPAGFLDNVHRQGAGMLDIPGAIESTTKIEPSKLSLGESEAGPSTHTLNVQNSSSSAVTYNLSHAPALSTGGSTFAPSFFTGFASVAFSSSSVAVPANGSASFDATITANPALPDRSQYGGYIVLTNADDPSDVARVPYAGFKGDYQSILVLNPAASAFGNPLLRSTLTFGPSEEVTFNPDADEVAWILVHLDHQVRRLRVEVREAGTMKNMGRAFDLQYVARNSGPSTFFVLEWDGVAVKGIHANPVPDGDYILRLSVLKALGDASNPDHVETWDSPIVTVDRSD